MAAPLPKEPFPLNNCGARLLPLLGVISQFGEQRVHGLPVASMGIGNKALAKVFCESFGVDLSEFF
jgi:hypothetical protein